MKIHCKHIILLIILSSQVWTNAISYFYHFVSEDMEMIELMESEEKESEESEKESKKEKELQEAFDLAVNSNADLIARNRALYNLGLVSSYFLKIEIPPPQLV